MLTIYRSYIGGTEPYFSHHLGILRWKEHVLIWSQLASCGKLVAVSSQILQRPWATHAMIDQEFLSTNKNIIWICLFYLALPESNEKITWKLEVGRWNFVLLERLPCRCELFIFREATSFVFRSKRLLAVWCFEGGGSPKLQLRRLKRSHASWCVEIFVFFSKPMGTNIPSQRMLAFFWKSRICFCSFLSIPTWGGKFASTFVG